MRPLDARRVGAVRRVSEQLEVRPQERDDVGLVLGLGRQSQLLWLPRREHVATELWLLVQPGGERLHRPECRKPSAQLAGLRFGRLLLGFARALRRSGLVALQVDDVAVVARCTSRFSISEPSTRQRVGREFWLETPHLFQNATHPT